MTHINQFSVMIADNGFIVQEMFQPTEKTVTLVARTEDELVAILKDYIEKRKSK